MTETASATAGFRRVGEGALLRWEFRRFGSLGVAEAGAGAGHPVDMLNDARHPSTRILKTGRPVWPSGRSRASAPALASPMNAANQSPLDPVLREFYGRCPHSTFCKAETVRCRRKGRAGRGQCDQQRCKVATRPGPIPRV